jgi:DNA polymerase III subunit beta
MNAISQFAATSGGMLALSICPKALRDALAAMRASGGAQIIERRNTIPILGCVLLDAQPDKLTIYGTDLDVMLSIELPAAVDGCGRVAVEFEALHKAAKGAKGETVRLVDMGGADASRGGRATFQHDSGTATLPTRSADDFPFIPTPDGLALFAIDGPTLKRDLDRVATCISTEETRYYLNGAFFHVVDDEYGRSRLRIVSTDGHRLARIDRERPEDAPEAMPDVILPSKPVHWIRRVGLKGGEGQAYLWFSASKFVFQRGRMRMVGKLVDGTFPDYSRVIPTQGGYRMTFPADALADAANLAHGHCSGRTRAMLLSIGQDWATMRATCPDNGTVSGMIEGSTFEPSDDASEFGLGMNAKYLGELMRDRKGEAVTLTMQDASAPIRIESDESPEFTTMLMPMRVDGDVYTPEDMRKATRDACEIFAEDMPTKLAAIAKLEAKLAETGNSYIADAVTGHRKEAGKLVTAAIDLLAARTGQPRFEARAAILRDLAAMKGEEEPLIVRARTAKAGCVEDKHERSVCDPAHVADACVVAVAEPQSPEPEPVESQAEPVAPAQEPVEEGVPMFASLQAFKAAAGQGSRWIVESWDDDAGAWARPRERTVATVRARSIGMLFEFADLDACQKADVRGFGGRTWIDFPKQGDWTSDAEGLIVWAGLSPETRAPNIRIRPASVEEAPAEDIAAESQPGELAAMRALVLELSARVAALEGAAQGEGEALAPVAAVEAVDAPQRRSAAHERAIRRAWAERKAARVRMGLLEAQRRRLHEAEDRAMAEAVRADEAERQVEEGQFLLDCTSRRVGKLMVRVARLSAVLAGRKAQIVKLGRDLLVARNRAADLRAEGVAPPALASVPSIAPRAHASQPSVPMLDTEDDADRYSAAC